MIYAASVVAPVLCDWGGGARSIGGGGGNPRIHNSCNFDGLIVFFSGLAGGWRGGGEGGIKGILKYKYALFIRVPDSPVCRLKYEHFY